MTTRRSLVHSGVAALAAALVMFVAPDFPLVARPLAQGQGAAQNEFMLELANPSNHYRLGIPDFQVPAGDPELAAAAKTLADVLAADIDFEREYYVIARTRSAAIPIAAPDALPYQNWTDLGADAVLVGSATRNAGVMSIELRMVWVRQSSRGKQAFGKAYPDCKLENPRSCAHFMADDFHMDTRGVEGVARTRVAFASTRDAIRVAGRPSQTPGIGKEIYLADYDGANPMRFTVNRVTNIMPSWSPVGGLLAYASYMSKFPDIYVANLAEPGRGLTRPAGGTEAIENWSPAWSPDGSKIAFASTRGRGTNIWVVNRDGSDLQNLTNNSSANGSPTWSPNGQQIAFTSDRAGTNQLYVMSANGTGLRVIVTDRVDRPTWSKAGFIAFTLGPDTGPHDIALYDFGTGSTRRLTDGVADNESPAVAPNGRHVAFVTSRWGKRQIATVDIAGGNIRRVTDVGENDYPSWGPISPLSK